MAKNDAIVLQANFEGWKQRATDLGDIDPWLYYCVWTISQIIRRWWWGFGRWANWGRKWWR